MNSVVPPRRATPSTPVTTLTDGLQMPRTLITTEGLPPHQQFEAWRAMAVPYLDVTAPTSGAGFAARGASLRFGPFLLYAATLPPYDYERRIAGIRRDSLDHWMVGMIRRGGQRQRSGDDIITFRTGIPYVLSMARPFEATRSGAVVDWIALHLARDAVPELEAGLAEAQYAPLDSAAGLLLADFLTGLTDRLDDVQAADLPHLASAVQALLGAALPRAGGQGAPPVELVQLARMRHVIRENLGAATLRPGRLAVLGGMSRSRLYRLFEPLGGVAHYIQRERLRHARRLLSDPTDRRDIATLAEAAGFFDPSSFSRAFRREFGCTPREMRIAALAGTAVEPAAALHGGGMLALLRDL